MSRNSSLVKNLEKSRVDVARLIITLADPENSNENIMLRLILLAIRFPAY